jgi:hypothetical protein
MRQNWSNDTFRLARVALEAAIPDQTTLLALLEQASAALAKNRASDQSMADQGASVHA